MKKVLIIIAILAMATAVWAGDTVTTHDMGDIKLHRFSDGTTGTTYDMGDIKLHRFSDGTSINTYDMGDTKIHKINEGVGDNLFRDYSAPEPSGEVDVKKYQSIFDD